MDLDLLDLYRSASEWSGIKVAGAVGELEAPTLCDEWSVRMLMCHMLETQRYFVQTARGENASPPSATPPEIMSHDPIADFERARIETLSTFGKPGIVKKLGQHSALLSVTSCSTDGTWPRPTDQDAAMPEGLPEAAYEIIHGRFSDDQRTGVFKPEIVLTSASSAQDKLLAYTGRDPSWRRPSER